MFQEEPEGEDRDDRKKEEERSGDRRGILYKDTIARGGMEGIACKRVQDRKQLAEKVSGMQEAVDENPLPVTGRSLSIQISILSNRVWFEQNILQWRV